MGARTLLNLWFTGRCYTGSVSQVEDKSKLLATLHDEYGISSDPAPLPEGSRGEAWQVHGRDAGAGLFALTGTAADCFRLDLVADAQRISPAGLLVPVDWGVVDWPGREQRVALVFPKLPKTTLADTMAQKRRYSEPEITGNILPRMVAVLRGLAEASIFHGGIRPSTMYLAPSGELTLGECFSAPPSARQPAWMLTIERGMAAPFGRGDGDVADEIYALGATLAYLTLGQVPAADMSETEMFTQKIERGSFAALVGRQQMANGLGELIRGMLDDDPQQRWSLETIAHWVAGRRLTSNQTRSRHKPSRGLMVNGIEYFDPRSLAEAFARNPSEAMKLMANDELIKWVKRTLKDQALTARIADAANMPMLRSRGSAEARLVARIITALDPSGPLRYAGLSMMPGGVGTMLQSALAAGESPQPFAEMLTCQLPKYWYNAQPSLGGDHLKELKRLEQAKIWLEKPNIGYGIERCLYDLAPASPLLGHDVARKLIVDMRTLLETLESMSERSDKPSVPLGRHVAAFALSRDPQNTKLFARFLQAHDAASVALGSLQGLAAWQKKLGLDKLPGLAKWLEGSVEPCLTRFHNRQAREAVRGELRKAAGAGDLQAMYDLIENPLAHHRDRDGFHSAMREYERLEYQIKTLHDQLKPGARLHSSLGNEAAMVVAGIMSTIVTAGIVLVQLKGLL